jgi:molecular chaperone HscB
MASPQSQSVPVLSKAEAELHACWWCGEMRAAQFCRNCGKIQPPRPSDHFSFFGLERRLNLDTAALEREMYRRSRQLHPDLYARSTAEEQKWSLEQTSKLNDAYRALRDPVRRTEYLLLIEGIRSASEPENGDAEKKKEAVPAELLEEVFELNLQLEAFRAGDSDHAMRREAEEAKKNFEQKLDEIDRELKRWWDRWDALMATPAVAPEERRRVLSGMAAVLHRRRYVAHLVQDIATALNE